MVRVGQETVKKNDEKLLSVVRELATGLAKEVIVDKKVFAADIKLY